jgi:ribonuclease HI
VVAIYADESCLGNGRAGDTPGGGGGLVEWRHPRTGELLRWDYWFAEPDTTNNRMALRSVIEAFRGLSKKGHTFSVVFTSDSKYIVDGMTSWVPGWMSRGWTRKTGPIENLALWQEAVEALGAHEREWRWVRGHNGASAERVREPPGHARRGAADAVGRARALGLRRVGDRAAGEGRDQDRPRALSRAGDGAAGEALPAGAGRAVTAARSRRRRERRPGA